MIRQQALDQINQPDTAKRHGGKSNRDLCRERIEQIARTAYQAHRETCHDVGTAAGDALFDRVIDAILEVSSLALDPDEVLDYSGNIRTRCPECEGPLVPADGPYYCEAATDSAVPCKPDEATHFAVSARKCQSCGHFVGDMLTRKEYHAYLAGE